MLALGRGTLDGETVSPKHPSIDTILGATTLLNPKYDVIVKPKFCESCRQNFVTVWRDILEQIMFAADQKVDGISK